MSSWGVPERLPGLGRARTKKGPEGPLSEAFEVRTELDAEAGGGEGGQEAQGHQEAGDEAVGVAFEAAEGHGPSP